MNIELGDNIIIRIKVRDGKKWRYLETKELCRLHFDKGKVYGVFTWDGNIYMGEKDFVIEKV